MHSSLKYSHLVLRLGLAAVFLWFGVDKFFDPTYWLNAWLPGWFVNRLALIGLSGTQFVYLIGIFETLVAVSLVTDILTKFFSSLAVVFLVLVMTFSGFNEVLARDIGLIAAFVSIILWPTNRVRF